MQSHLAKPFGGRPRRAARDYRRR